MKLKGVIRVEANSEIGMGHATRALALCEMLIPDSEISVAFRNMPDNTKEEFSLLGCDLIPLEGISISDEYPYIKSITDCVDYVIVDGYSFLDKFKEDVISSGIKLVLIDDNADPSVKADLVINHSPGLTASDYPTFKSSNLLLGLDFVMLRSQFLNETIHINKKKQGILVCLGGSDPKKISNVIVDSLLTYTDETIHCVLGELNSNFDTYNKNRIIGNKLFLHKGLTASEMKNLMRTTNAGICSSSTISLECIASRLPIAVGWSVDNQKNIYDGITGQGLALGLGNFDHIKSDRIAESVMSLITQEKIKKRMINSQAYSLDLKSPTRIRKAILEK